MTWFELYITLCITNKQTKKTHYQSHHIIITISSGQTIHCLSIFVRELEFVASLIVWFLISDLFPHPLSDPDQKSALPECNWTSCCPFPADMTFYLTPPIGTWLPKCAKREIHIPFHFTSGCEANHSTLWVISMIRV